MGLILKYFLPGNGALKIIGFKRLCFQKANGARVLFADILL
jgi:hypothetical protein